MAGPGVDRLLGALQALALGLAVLLLVILCCIGLIALGGSCAGRLLP